MHLPTEVDGWLSSSGVCRTTLGDGEVCVTGIEAPMTVTARVDVRPDMEIFQPQVETLGTFTPTGEDEPMYGIDPDLREATKTAIRHMIDHLQAEHGLTRGDAYKLCFDTVDLKINEVVDAPNWTVSTYLPESIFS